MAERISHETVSQVARLSLLRLQDSELDAFTEQLRAVLDHAVDIESLDLTGVEPMTHPFSLRNVMREDEIDLTISPNEVLDSAPSVEQDQFQVPPMLGEAP